ncbi:hypothetical protein FB45DRAFT_943023 [Roridomyces roridus]|uniref:DUF6534 domain-containing protein n=1 Tax=Roridomyces roridus TaxID=1738132 RepID=A0AAD7B4G2_9AGAR|nr:hypothetical protein FB45DRAFT_943023 [Roridomyces roridus]
MATSSLPVPAAVSQHLVETTLGAVFFGLVFSCILFGVSSLQVYLYYHHYPNDGLLYKGSIGVLWILDAFHVALTIFSSYHYGVASFGSLEKLEIVIWSFKLATAVQVVIIVIVQSMYTYRLWLLSGYHHGVLRYIVTAVVLGGFGIGVLLTYETYTISTFAELPSIAWAIEASFSASTTIDVGLSAAMCWYLRKSKNLVLHSHSSYGGSGGQLNSRISGLIQYTLSCGVFTSVCSLAALATFIAMPDNLIFLALTFILTRLYMNSYTAMMNTRRRQDSSSGGGGGGGASFSISGAGHGGRSGAEAVVSIPLWTNPGSRTQIQTGDVESQRTQPGAHQFQTSTAAQQKALEALDWGHGNGQREEDIGYPPYARDW